MLQVGSVLDGKYKILNEIGHGGMSVVYLALNERANKTWAVKEVRKNGDNDNEVVSQGLVAETEMLKKLNHPNLPSIVDVIDTQDSFIIVMDYIEGKSLQSLITNEGPQSVERVVGWAKQLTNVLGYLHNRRPPIIYRDMKPANVMLKPNGEDVVLIDFGTAREYKETKQGDTTWLGTRGYAAPEQFGGRGQTDARTDIYNLGATMYHLLTGYSPADTQFVIYPLGQLRPELAGTGIEKIVTKCCQPDPAHRYQSCEELMYALDHYQEIDEAAIKARNRKWYLFLASIAVCILGIIGMITFKLLENGARSKTYDSKVQQAMDSTDFSEYSTCLTEAIDLNPSKEEAYDALIEKIIFDKVIDRDEDKLVRTCLQSTMGRTGSGMGDGSNTNQEQLKQKNPEKYASLNYRLAINYYSLYDETDKYQRTQQFVTKALEMGDALSDIGGDKKTQLDALKMITLFSASYDPQKGISSVTQDYEASDVVTAKDFFDAMNSYISAGEDMDSTTGSMELSLALCKEAENLIVLYYNDFVTHGVAKDEIIEMNNNIGKYIRFIANNPDIQASLNSGSASGGSSNLGKMYTQVKKSWEDNTRILEQRPENGIPGGN
ncbi:MAG: serine/threonine protein kinase [Solobacterium sp.]|nr:serine/threonine protein kinase [Solobacterium sp.]